MTTNTTLSDDRIASGKRIQRRTGKTFHLATRLLPRRIRHQTYVLYGFFRVADEVVDGPGPHDPDQQRDRLEEIREAALGDRHSDDPVLDGFNDVREAADIDPNDVNAFIDSMCMDIDIDRYETNAGLDEYIDGSAAAVGRMMTAVMDVDDPATARPHATALGKAFQLTNFLRDVREDVVDLGRVYLPAETLEAHGTSVEQIRQLEFDHRVREAIRAELLRTERLYHHGVAGIRLLPKDCQFAVLLAAVLYGDHHRLIRARGYDTVSAKPELATRRKLWIVIKTRWYWQWNRDPVAVFEAVTDWFERDRVVDGAQPRASAVDGD